MPADHEDADDFYRRLFVENPTWSTPYPNVEESRRVAKIVPLLSDVARRHRDRGTPMRILDLGCGRGWLTYLASVYGECVGIDPVAPVVDSARQRFPALRFEVGSTPELLDAGESGRFDVVLSTEVIEHVPVPGRDRFVADIRQLLAPDGVVILTTDRGELYRRWARRQGTVEQPEENWLTERDLEALFARHGFVTVAHDRAYYDLPELSWFHRVVASARFGRVLTRLRQRWLLDGLRYAAANCQVWSFAVGSAPPG